MNVRYRQIINLAVPSIVSNITIPLLGLIDVAIVGHMGNAAYIGAIAVGSMIFNVIYWIFGFLRMGTSGMTSQALGRRDLAELMRLLIRSLSIGLAIALCFLVFQIPLRTVAMYLMHPNGDIVNLASIYFNICIWGAPAMLSLYGLTGWFIGMQNTRIPMFVSIMQNVVNIIASLTLVFAFHMRIEGVAIGTLIAQWSGLMIVVVLWLKYYRRLLAYLDSIKNIFSRDAMFKFFNVNRDIFFRTLFLVAVNLFFTSASARQGTIILSVNTLLLTFFTIFSYFMDGFAFAGEALSGRYYGSHNMVALNDVKRKLFVIGGLVMAFFTLLFVFGNNVLISILTDNKSVIEASSDYMLWVVCIPIAGVAAFIYDGLFIGITATCGMLISSAIATIMFFAFYFSLNNIIHNHALWLAFIVYLSTRGIIQCIIYQRIIIKR
jgi:MATE family multidrug resistance protein